MSSKNSLLRVGRPTAKPTYGIHNPIGSKFLTRFRLVLSHPNEHKFKHNCKDCVNSLCILFSSALSLFDKHILKPLS